MLLFIFELLLTNANLTCDIRTKEIKQNQTRKSINH